MEEFKNVIKDFLADILLTYPEYEDIINKEEYKDYEHLYAYCKELYPKHFFQILYKKDELFEEDINLLPEINFKDLWVQEISDNTRETVWRYLQLILFNCVGDVNTENPFGDTAELFKEIDHNELKSKLDECLNDMQELFGKEDDIKKDAIPNVDDLHKNIESMLDGKLGSLAKEIANDVVEDLDILDDNVKNPDEVFKKLFANPGKLMNLVKTVGSKLDDKMKTGDIKENDILDEASNLMKTMDSMPGFNNMKDLFSKFNPQQKGMHNQFNQKMKSNDIKQKLKNKQEKKEKLREKEVDINNLEDTFKKLEEDANKMMNELLEEEKRQPKKKKKNRKKKKTD